MCSAHLLKFVDRISPILVNGLRICLKDARRGMADHLGNEEIRDSGSAQATGKGVALAPSSLVHRLPFAAQGVDIFHFFPKFWMALKNLLRAGQKLTDALINRKHGFYVPFTSQTAEYPRPNYCWLARTRL
jgi:hypothetical protein